jgi:hypothetical protein
VASPCGHRGSRSLQRDPSLGRGDRTVLLRHQGDDQRLMAKPPKTFVFTREPTRRRCYICVDAEMKEWLSSCLQQTLDAGEVRPLGTRVHKELVSAFGEARAPNTDNSTRRHLLTHEPLWNEWKVDG